MFTKEELQSLFDYNADMGALFWKEPRPHVRVGMRAGCVRDHGYRVITVNGQQLREHRLIWVLENGDCPPAILDHIDGNRSNNHIANLRESSPSLNQRNRKARGYSQTVTGKWVAALVKDGIAYRKSAKATEAEALADRLQLEAEHGYTTRRGED